MTGNDREVVIWPELSWKWLYKAYNQVLGTFELLQGFNSQEVAVMVQEMTSRDRK